jgi:hypothetical protein
MRYLSCPDGSYDHFDDHGVSTRGVYVREYDLRLKEFNRGIHGGSSGYSSGAEGSEALGILTVWLFLIFLAWLPFSVGQLAASDILRAGSNQAWSFKASTQAFPSLFVLGVIHCTILWRRLGLKGIVFWIGFFLLPLQGTGPERFVFIGYALLVPAMLYKQETASSHNSDEWYSAGTFCLIFLLVAFFVGFLTGSSDTLRNYTEGTITALVTPKGGVVLLTIILALGQTMILGHWGLGSLVFLSNLGIWFLCADFIGNGEASSDALLRLWSVALIGIVAASILYEYREDEDGQREVVSLPLLLVIVGLLLKVILEVVGCF